MGEILELTTETVENWDDELQEFVYEQGVTYKFLYNLLALDRWETNHKKRFIDNKDLSPEEILDFIREMCISDNFEPEKLSQADFDRIVSYMQENPSATHIPKQEGSARPVGVRKKIFTSEIIYAHMALNHIPFDWEKRNLNKLILLINAISELQNPPKKMTKGEIMEEQRKTILARRAEAEARMKANMKG